LTRVAEVPAAQLQQEARQEVRRDEPQERQERQERQARQERRGERPARRREQQPQLAPDAALARQGQLGQPVQRVGAAPRLYRQNRRNNFQCRTELRVHATD
jgi:hypothetical protein